MFSLFGRSKDPRHGAGGIGRDGEDIAASFLRDRGYVIRGRNYRQPYGEIDIIAEIDGTLVFVEVKARTSTWGGRPFEAVDDRKQQRMIKAALHYMSAHRLHGRPARFDVIGVLLPPGRPPEIDHIANAFEPGG